MDYEITKAASNDLETIWLYSVANWSLEQADRYINLILDELDHLCQFPLSGKDLGIPGKEYRTARVKSHLIFYRLKTKQKIEVVRVLHESVDFLDWMEE